MIDTVICGDALETMAGMDSESVDLVVTDPPYGISFMGKAWDKALPSVDVWRECLRVLKPGAFAFVMCIPRQDCLSRMIINLEDAGFMVNFSPILWTYATGFPKAANLSKLADKRAGFEREVVGKNPNWRDRSKHTGDVSWAEHDRASGKTEDTHITAPATPEAKALEGSYAGFQPKPAYEAILVAMRPLTEKTYLDQALANGHGCTHLDAGRIPYEGAKDKRSPYKADGTQGGDNAFHGDNTWGDSNGYMQQHGRFAPNLLVSDDCLNDGVVRKTGELKPCKRANRGGFTGPMSEHATSYSAADSGSFSRYFSLDAWSEANLPDSVKRTFPFLIVPKASKSEKNAGLDELEDRKEGHLASGTGGGGGWKADSQKNPNLPRKNHHPTCKPIKLMSYLISIGSRPGDVVLDCYGGSGTTGVAAALLDRRYILIELDAEYVDIAERRIAWHVEQKGKDENAQLKLNI